MRKDYELTAVVLAAVFAALPAALPGGELYVDNAPHLVELRLLAEQVLGGDLWFSGWADGPLGGFAVGELNAPLAWVPLALLVALGLPVVPLYALATLASNAVLGVGMLKLARKVLPGGAVVAALLAVSAPVDLYGIGGATGGMWPYRLACGLGLWWWARPRGVVQDATWLSLILLTHTYTGVMAFGWLLLMRWHRALPAIGLATLATAAFWGPILAHGLSETVRAPYPWTPGEVALLHLLPVDVFTWRVYNHMLEGDTLARLLELGTEAFVGQAWSLVWQGVLLVGGLVALRRVRPSWQAVLAVGAVAVVMLAHLDLLGPNPWRYLVAWRLGLCLLAGAVVPRAVAAVLPLLALGVGLREGTVCLGEAGEACAALERTWEALEAAEPEGLVFHQDSFWRPTTPEVLRGGHVGAMLSVHTDLPVLSSWYGVTPIATVRPSASDVGVLFGRPERAVYADPDAFFARCRTMGVGSVISVTPELADFLDADPRYRQVTREGPFGAWVLTTPPQAAIGAAAGPVELVTVERGHLVAEVPAGPLRVRRSHHPWWVATLDGEPLEITDDGNGLIGADAPHAGTLELVWARRGQGFRWLSLLGVLGLLVTRWTGKG